MVMISVPAIMAVPTTRSPSCEFSLLTVPVERASRWWSWRSSSSARASEALAIVDLVCGRIPSCALATSSAVLAFQEHASRRSACS